MLRAYPEISKTEQNNSIHYSFQFWNLVLPQLVLPVYYCHCSQIQNDSELKTTTSMQLKPKILESKNFLFNDLQFWCDFIVIICQCCRWCWLPFGLSQVWFTLV